MSKLHLYWTFFKGTVTISLVFSTLLALLLYPQFFTLFPLALMTGGPVIGFAYKEIFRKKEYYFYYNRGISKIKLYAATLVFHFIAGGMVFIVLRWAISLK